MRVQVEDSLEIYHLILEDDVGQPRFCGEALSLLHQVIAM